MSAELPTLPQVVTVNEFLNVVPHDASKHPVNANANLAILWAEAVEARGFDPTGVTFCCNDRRYSIFRQSGRWQTFYA